MPDILTINGVDTSANTDWASVRYEENASGVNAILRLTLFWNAAMGAMPAVPVQKQEITLTGSANWFGGVINTISPSQEGGTLYWDIEATDYTCFSDTRTVTSGVIPAGQTDVQIIATVWAFRGDVNASTYVVSQSATTFPAMDFTGWRIRAVMEWLAGYTGARWWVDSTKNLHYVKASPAEKVNEGDFEKSGAAWTLAGVVASVPAEGNVAGYALKHVGNGVNSANMTTQVIAATAGQSFVLGIDAKCTVASNWKGYISWRNGANAEISQSSFGSVVSNSVWTRLWTIVSAPALTASAVVTLTLNAAGSTATAWYDNVTVAQVTSTVGLSDTPSDVAFPVQLKAYESPKGPSEAASCVNRLYIYGTGYSGTFNHYPSQAFFGGTVIEDAITDPLVTSAAQAQLRADAYFALHALPTYQVTVEHQQTAIRAGLVLPFVWSTQGIAAPILASRTTGQYLGASWVLTTTLGGDQGAGGSVSSLLASHTATIGYTNDVVFDTVAPAVPTGLGLSSSVGLDADGGSFSTITATWSPNTDQDFDHYEVALALDSGFTSGVQVRSLTSVGCTFAPLLGATTYYARIRAWDWANNGSAWSGTVSLLTSKDAIAPLVPSSITVTPGFRLAGLTWARNSEADLAKYQVRWTTDDAAATGNPDAAQWSRRDVYANTAIITGLDAGSTSADGLTTVAGKVYYFQVRAIDSSGNTATSTADTTAVAAESNSEAGWSNSAVVRTGVAATTLAANATVGATNIKAVSVTGFAAGHTVLIGTVPEFRKVLVVGTAGAGGTGIDLDLALTAAHASGQQLKDVMDAYATGTPTLVGGSDIAVNSIKAWQINTIGLDASIITSGTVKIGGPGGSTNPGYLLIYNTAGVEIGRWDATGLVVRDVSGGVVGSGAVRLKSGILEFTTAYNSTTPDSSPWSTAISASGITADSIKLGSAPGGHNAIPNSSFELAAFTTTLSKTWTAAADWGTTIGVDVNVTKTGSELAATSNA